jgi:hypothetical protein
MITTTHNYTSDLEGGNFTSYSQWLEAKYGAEEATKITEADFKSSEPTTPYTDWIVDQKMTHEVTHEDGTTTSLSYKELNKKIND